MSRYKKEYCGYIFPLFLRVEVFRVFENFFPEKVSANNGEGCAPLFHWLLLPSLLFSLLLAFKVLLSPSRFRALSLPSPSSITVFFWRVVESTEEEEEEEEEEEAEEEEEEEEERVLLLTRAEETLIVTESHF